MTEESPIAVLSFLTLACKREILHFVQDDTFGLAFGFLRHTRKALPIVCHSERLGFPEASLPSFGGPQRSEESPKAFLT